MQDHQVELALKNENSFLNKIVCKFYRTKFEFWLVQTHCANLDIIARTEPSTFDMCSIFSGKLNDNEGNAWPIVCTLICKPRARLLGLSDQVSSKNYTNSRLNRLV